ncbi:LANO_0H13960g1_1 [Lachancea nothofagi CBS 11611]|uniref:LANO_0H13960g1_1 n=1 Tax=Lachancea nothofagi CBS 11611 TaxID=1266666 RepID=A0A1G4KMK2_9SACH|nr:LANO_0H13960g1_1 [Lachancea nothofagi CBS 11611]
MTKAKVIIPYKNRIELAEELPDWSRLNSQIEFVKYKITTQEAFRKDLKESNADCLWITDDFFAFLNGPSAYYDDFPTSLKLIVVPWVGTDFLDISRLKREKNVIVCNIGPNAASNVAELALYLTLSCFRMTSFFEHCFRFVHTGQCFTCAEYIGGSKHVCQKTSGLNNSMPYPFPEKLTHEQSQNVELSKNFTIAGKSVNSPSGKTALILGFGYIGQAIGKKLHYGLDMKIAYHRRSGPVSKEVLGYDAEYCKSLEDQSTWTKADVIVLALPGHSSTNDIINRKTLGFCKDKVRIVNVGRGSCIDEDALFEALESGKVCSAGLDVYKNEDTKVDARFFERWDVTLLPHIGSAIAEMISRQTLITLQNIEDVLLKDGRGVYPVN